MPPGHATPRYAIVQSAVGGADPDLMAQIMLPLMLRNVSSELFRFEDPADPAKESAPGCVVAAPSTGTNLPSVKQDYVYAWVRDAAVVATEVALGDRPGRDDRLRDYVRFSRLCQADAESAGHVARAAFTIDPRRHDLLGRPGRRHPLGALKLRVLPLGRPRPPPRLVDAPADGLRRRA